MKRILYVNPVGNTNFNRETEAFIDAVRSPEFEPVVRSLDEGPPHLEYHLYEHAAAGPMFQLFKQAEQDGFLAGIIGCFYDGGLRELRELVKMPVIGMAEASLAYAATLGHKFSIIVGRRKWIPKMEDHVVLYGHERRLASFRAIDMGMPDYEVNSGLFLERCLDEARRAVDEDGAEVVVLSEYANPAFWERARQELPAPIVDPGVVCWKFAEMAADLYDKIGYTHSKIGGYEAPVAREAVLS